MKQNNHSKINSTKNWIFILFFRSINLTRQVIAFLSHSLCTMYNEGNEQIYLISRNFIQTFKFCLHSLSARFVSMSIENILFSLYFIKYLTFHFIYLCIVVSVFFVHILLAFFHQTNISSLQSTLISLLIFCYHGLFIFSLHSMSSFFVETK